MLTRHNGRFISLWLAGWLNSYSFYLICCCRDELEAERTERAIKDSVVNKLASNPRKSVMKRFSISGKGNAPPPMRRMSLVDASNS